MRYCANADMRTGLIARMMTARNRPALLAVRYCANGDMRTAMIARMMRAQIMMEAVVVTTAGSEVTVMDTMDAMKVIMAGSVDTVACQPKCSADYLWAPSGSAIALKERAAYGSAGSNGTARGRAALEPLAVPEDSSQGFSSCSDAGVPGCRQWSGARAGNASIRGAYPEPIRPISPISPIRQSGHQPNQPN